MIRRFICATLLAACTAAAQTDADRTVWQTGSGTWTDRARWSAGLPDPYRKVFIHGDSAVGIPEGTYLAGDLRIGESAHDRARVEVNGGRLILVEDSLHLGEASGGEAEFVLNRGAMHCVMDVFVGGANAVERTANRSTLTIRGGSFLGRTLTVGTGLGSQTRVSIEGSQASAVHVLDSVYLLAKADDHGEPASSTLAFTLDEHGVTPVTIQSRRDGLRIIKDTASRCRLEIALRAVPPREDVTLIATRVPVQGTFDDLPEGAEIAAQYSGRTYRWTLTYRGGPSGHDVVLRNRSEYAADAPVSHVRPVPEPPSPLWREHPLHPLAIQLGTPAFPGAEGYGAYTRGGVGGRTIWVDNLNDSGPGSLRAAVQARGPRTVRFRVGGAIRLASTLVMHEPFLTIDGQDAPGAGILLRNHGIEVGTHDVVLRYFRVRVGDDELKSGAHYESGEGEHALYFTDGAKNCIADHVSLSWSTSKVLSVTHMSDLISIQWCILSESLNIEGHGYASLCQANRVTWHHNLLAHNLSRNVRFQGPVDADFRNNVIYDWGHTGAYGEFDRVNYVGNYLKPGPSTTQRPPMFHNGEGMVFPGSLFVLDNVIERNAQAIRDNWTAIGYDRSEVEATEPFPAPPVATDSAETAFEHVLQQAGAVLPMRDSTDRRIVREVRDGTGRIIESLKDIGGWLEFPATRK